jgi:hypothetical protein
VQANVKQLVAFQMSVRDVEILHKELGIEHDDLTHLDMHSCYIAMLAADRHQSTISLKAISPPEADATLAEGIRTRCRVRYTYPVDEVDAMLKAARARSTVRRTSSLPRERKNRLSEQALGASSNEVPPSNESPFIQEK